MKRTHLFLALAVCSVMMVVATTSCHKDSSPTTMTLYDSLGGTKLTADPNNPSTQIETGRLGIRSVVDSAIFVIAADDSINSYFTVLLAEVTAGNMTGFEELSKNLTDFFCVATGAQHFQYTGLSMTDAHNPATNPRINNKVDNADFDEFINDVGIAAQKNGLASDVIARLAAVAETTRGQVVQR